MSTPALDLAAELRLVPKFSGMEEDALRWLAGRMNVVTASEGELVIPAGTKAELMIIVLEGELTIRTEGPGDNGTLFVISAGEISGLLPYSRLEVIPMNVRATMPSRIATLHSSHFPEMIERFPALVQRLVGIMSDRIRNSTRDEQQRGKLIALGKMSAGLAHELNNPAAAAMRAAESLRHAVACMRTSELTIDRLGLAPEERARISQAELELLAAPPATNDDPLERSDREQALGMWLESRNVPHAWQLASSLADAGFDLPHVKALAANLPAEVSGAVLNRLGASLSVDKLVEVVESSTQRISELVRAVKEYSYMDQGPEQEVDIHDGIENTLLILGYRLKQNVQVTREFDRTLPKICAFGRELNQVWTNLFVNALDAMHDRGDLIVRTSREGNRALVEVIDSGPGIPAEAQAHLFHEFFTTKAPGEGTGLGLEMAARIVRKHRGEIGFETRPGRTVFQVRLPLQIPK